MSDHFVVEAGRRVVGLAVRSPGGDKFFSSDEAYSHLEGRTFARARSLSNAVAKVGRSQMPRAVAGRPAAPTAC